MPSSDGKTLAQITRLDNSTLKVVCYNEDDTVRDITGDTLRFEARYKVADTSMVFVKHDEQIERLDPENGLVHVHINADDTLALSKTATLKCQLVMTDELGRDATVMVDLPVRYRK